MGRILWLITATALLGCGSDPPCEDCEPDPPEPDPPFSPWLWDGACEPGTYERNGECLAPATGAGIPAEACADGFVALNDGCEPVLPSSDCAPGTMAPIGETRCRPVADCGTGTWGSVPLDNGAVYVDPSFSGQPLGTASNPYNSVDAALANAPSGAMVVLAQGTYPAITIDTPVRLWGRCPELVEVGPITINAAAEIHRLHARGGQTTILVQAGPTQLDELRVSESTEFGIRAFADTVLSRSLVEDGRRGAVVESASLTVEDSVIRDGPQAGIIARAPLGGAPSSLSVVGTLVELRGDIGIYVRGAEATISGSVIRRTAMYTGFGGYGLLFQPDPENGARPASGRVEGCLVADNVEDGINVTHSIVAIVETVVRGTQPAVGGRYGRGVLARASDSTLGVSDVEVTRSLVENNRDGGVLAAGARIRVEDSIVRGTLPQLVDGRLGRGVSGQSVADEEPTTIEVVNSLVIDNHDAGVGALGVSVLVENSRVVGTKPRLSDLYFGQGIGASPHDASGLDSPSDVTVRSSVVEDAFEAGIAVIGGRLVVEDTRIFDIHSSAHDGLIGIGLTAQGAGELPHLATSGHLHRVWIHDVHAAAAVGFDADMVIDASYFHDILPSEVDAQFGDGVVATTVYLPQSSLQMSQSRVDRSARAGVALFGPTAALLSGNQLVCNLISLNGEGAYDFTDGGGNRCGCDQEEACKVVSSMLLPPDPLP